MNTFVRASQFMLVARLMLRRLFWPVFVFAVTVRMAMADYTVGSLDFSYLSPPQYAALDLGNSSVVDMDDWGDVLFWSYDYDDYELWSAGTVTALPNSDGDDNVYEWQFAANDGEVLGLYYGADDTLGVARWDGAATSINEDVNTIDVVPEDADSWDWPIDLNYTRDGSIYLGVEYSVQEVLATDYFDDPVGPDNYYYRKYKWSPYGSGLTQVGDTTFESGDASYETPEATITYPIATTDNTLNQVFGNTTYSDTVYDNEIGYVDGEGMDGYTYGAVYYNSTAGVDNGGPFLQLNGVTVPYSTFGAYDDTPELTHVIADLNYPTLLDAADFFGATLGYLHSGNFSAANLTANADSDTPLAFYEINPNGFALTPIAYSQMWLNGATLLWADVLPAYQVNDDGSANFTAMLPTANLSANISYELDALQDNNLGVAGDLYDEDTYVNHAFVLVPVGGGGGGALIADQNGDGVISLDLDDQATPANPYSFWLNDQPVDSGNSTERCADGVVNGAGDLANYFPVFVNIQNLIAQLPPSDSITYYLVQGDSAVNFVYTNLERPYAYTYLTGNLSTGFGPDFDQPAASATKQQVTSGGVELSGNFLQNIAYYNQGVILVEGRTDTTQPLELVVRQDGVKVVDIPLYLSLAPRILLLLHGMNSNTATWDHFVHDDFGSPVASFATNIVNGNIVGGAPLLSGNSVSCYRLQFGHYDDPGVAGLTDNIAGVVTNVTSENTPNYLTGNVTKCGDFETFDQLGQEVDDALSALEVKYPDAQIVLVGHSRGGLSARDFLENPDFEAEQANVVGLLTTSTPHQGGSLGEIYNWLGSHLRGYSSGDYTSDDNTMDWSVVDFLCSQNAITVGNFSFIAKDTLDVRRPVIGDVASGSAAITALNGNIGNLPSDILYGEIVYDKVDLGYLKKDHWWSAYSVFTGGWFIGPKMSTPAQNDIIGESYFPSDYPGDGLVPYQSAYLTTMDGFSGLAIEPFVDSTDDVLHAQATSRTDDLNTQLNAMEPTWFPPPP